MAFGLKRFRKPLTAIALGIAAGGAVAMIVNRFAPQIPGVQFVPAVGAYIVGGPMGAVGYLIGSGALTGILGATSSTGNGW